MSASVTIEIPIDSPDIGVDMRFLVEYGSRDWSSLLPADEPVKEARMPEYVTPKQVEIFWSAVDMSGGPTACWPWLGYRSRTGYGKFLIGSRKDGSRRKAIAHRVAFWIEHGYWPEPCGMHTCDNRACCNPAHIVPGSQLDNMRDMYAKGRNRDDNGANGPRAKLTEVIVCDARRRFWRGEAIADIARLYGVTWNGMQAAILCRSWRRLES